MLSIFLVKLFDYRRSIPLLLGFVGMMLVFTYIFGLAFSGGTYIPTAYVVNRADSEEVTLLIDRLHESDKMNFKEVTYDQAVNKLENSNGVGAIVLDLEDGALSTSIMSTQPSTETVVLRNILTYTLANYVNDMKLSEQTYTYIVGTGADVGESVFKKDIRQAVNDLRQSKTYFSSTSSYVDVKTTGYDNLKHALTGFTIFFSMFLGFFGIGSIVEEKMNYVWQRQLVSPVSNLSILGGNLMAALLVGIINVIVMIYGGKFLFNIDWGSSDLGVILVLVAFVFASTCLGLVISTLVKNMQQLSTITPVIVVSTSMLGGCMWPLEFIESKALLTLARFTPQRWAIESIEKMIMYGKGFETVLLPIGVLLGMGVVLLGLGSYLVKIEK